MPFKRADFEQAMRNGGNLASQYAAGDNEQKRQQTEASLKKLLMKQEQDSDIEGLKRVQDMSPSDASSVQYGKAHVGADPYARLASQQMRQQSTDYKNLQNAAKPVQAINQELDHAHYMHALLDNPNQVDEGTFNTLKGLAAAGGSGSRALATIMRAQGTTENALQGDFQHFQNYMSGAANTNKSPQQIQAARDSLLKYQDEILQRYEDQKTRFRQQAPIAAPSIFQSGQLPQLIESELQPLENKSNELRKRKQDYLQRQNQGLNPGPTTMTPPQGNPGAPSVVDRLKSLMGGQGQGQQPSQGNAPMSFEEFKKRKAAGQL